MAGYFHNLEKLSVRSVLGAGTKNSVSKGRDEGNCTASTRRCEGLDFARAVAVFGMILINFNAAMAEENPRGGWIAFVLDAMEGRAAATFIILAGMGIVLIASKKKAFMDPTQFRILKKVLVKRALVLFAIGLSYSEFWPPDILHFYGLYLPIGIIFLKGSDRKIWAGILFFSFGFLVINHFIAYETGWDFRLMEYSDFWSTEGMVRHIFFNGYYPVFPWASFLLLGIWLGRKKFHEPRFRKKALTWSLALLAATEMFAAVLSGFFPPFIFEERISINLHYFGRAPYPPMPLFLLSAAAAAVALIMICMNVMQKYGGAFWVKTLAVAGRMSLTAYIGHVLIGMFVLDRLGVLIPQQPPWFVLFCGCCFFILFLCFALRWEKRFSKGPLEFILRKVSGS